MRKCPKVAINIYNAAYIDSGQWISARLNRMVQQPFSAHGGAPNTRVLARERKQEGRTEEKAKWQRCREGKEDLQKG